MTFLVQWHSVWQLSSVTKSTGLHAIKTLGLVEAVRDAQEKLKRRSLTIDERATPQETCSPVLGLDRWARNRQHGSSRWQRRKHGANLSRVLVLVSSRWVDTKMHCDSRWRKAQSTLHWTRWHSVATQGYDWTFLCCKEDYVSINDGRNQMTQQEPSAWPTLTNTDNKHRNASLEVTERSCTMWVATSFSMSVAILDSNRKEKWFSWRWRRKSSLNHGWRGSMGAPRAVVHPTRLHSRRRGSSSLLFSHAKRTRRDTSCGTSGASENQQVRERSGSHWHLFTAQRTIRSRVGHAPSQAYGVQTSNHQSIRQRWTITTRVAETSEHGAGEIHRRDSPFGHRTQGLERNVVRTSPVFSFVPFGTEPLLVNTESKTNRIWGWVRKRRHAWERTGRLTDQAIHPADHRRTTSDPSEALHDAHHNPTHVSHRYKQTQTNSSKHIPVKILKAPDKHKPNTDFKNVGKTSQAGFTNLFCRHVMK